MSTPKLSRTLLLNSDPAYGLPRRTIDLAIACTALVFLSPLMVIIAAAVMLESGRPILFRHPRIGVSGQPFRMYKFRKFYETGDTIGPPLTMNNDGRFTKVGKFLARSKLDELPQLWNVLKGDMAIVGPRPESLEFSECFRGGFEEVLRYKPGLVGPSQVLFRDESSYYPVGEDETVFYRQVIFPIKAGLDIAYFRHRTLGSDFVWMMRSALAIFGFVKGVPTLGA
jgi:lipopolysaccharide/colanic/teichoic acid biosynthesis glycosyltransferase